MPVACCLKYLVGKCKHCSVLDVGQVINLSEVITLHNTTQISQMPCGMFHQCSWGEIKEADYGNSKTELRGVGSTNPILTNEFTPRMQNESLLSLVRLVALLFLF